MHFRASHVLKCFEEPSAWVVNRWPTFRTPTSPPSSGSVMLDNHCWFCTVRKRSRPTKMQTGVGLHLAEWLAGTTEGRWTVVHRRTVFTVYCRRCGMMVFWTDAVDHLTQACRTLLVCWCLLPSASSVHFSLCSSAVNVRQEVSSPWGRPLGVVR